MFKIQSTYSGIMVARERGVHRVCNDNRVVFTSSRRERSFLDSKIPPRRVKWTEQSRVFFKKTHKNTGKKTENIPIIKIVRGFTMVPKSLLEGAKTKRTETASSGASQKGEKVGKNANIGSVRK